MRSFVISLIMLVPLVACTTPKSPEEAKAQRCQVDTSECEQRIRDCQRRADELTCRSQENYCKEVRARCPGY